MSIAIGDDAIPQGQSVGLSPNVMAWLLSLLSSVTLSIGSPDFEEQALMAIKAKQELMAILAANKEETI